MNKKRVSVILESQTDIDVRKIAQKERRSFSQMVNLLLEMALKNIKK